MITIENISKQYRIGTKARQSRTLSEAIIKLAGAPLENLRRLRGLTEFNNSRDLDIIWALKNISFEVQSGEVIGIIGRNGAGKSTLLKVLSRITPPTKGRVKIQGRVSSLLEVGTGFHPELTGRENIYLNGTILGMRKNEVDRRFDEIVSFSGIEKFIDTPVKRYSSGMSVRLAFSVAAHLEPEVLIIDEVLAVGDHEFQSKCLGKMSQISQTGRTILFVSHNMPAVQALCSRAVLLSEGVVIEDSNTETVIANYLGKKYHSNRMDWNLKDAPGNRHFKLLAMKVYQDVGVRDAQYFSTNRKIFVDMVFEIDLMDPNLGVGFNLFDDRGNVILNTYHTDMPTEKWPKVRRGTNSFKCSIPEGLLNTGQYHIAPRIGIHNQDWIVNMDPVVSFAVIADHSTSRFWHGVSVNKKPGILAMVLKWEEV